MNPFQDPFNPFGGMPGDPMEEVLALQSYATSAGTVGSDCKSNVSCGSNQSCASFASSNGSSSGQVAEPGDGFVIR